MKFVRIFVSKGLEDGLWSIRLDHEPQSEFEKFFDLVNDVQWLHHFFDRNKADLHSGYFGKVTIGGAVSRTLDEAGEMEDVLYDFSERGFKTGVEKQNQDSKRLVTTICDPTCGKLLPRHRWSDQIDARHEKSPSAAGIKKIGTDAAVPPGQWGRLSGRLKYLQQ